MSAKTRTSAGLIAASAGYILGLGTSGTYAQSSQPDGAQTTLIEQGQTEAAPINPHKANLAKLQRTVTIELEDTRLEDIIEFIKSYTGAEIEPLWSDDQREGLDQDEEITISVRAMTALAFLEEVLDKAESGFSGNQWQMTPWGTVQIGPKQLLNRRKTTVMYDISDLLMEIPDWPDAPEMDLQSILQQDQGGGQSPFENIDDVDVERKTREELAQEIVNIVTTLIEPDEWIDNGGNGASVRYWQGVLIVNAPDYIHRQLDGYSYWPVPTQTRTTQGGRRYVTLGIDQSIGTVQDIQRVPVTGTAGGQGGGGNGGGGG